ncbi:MAG: ribonuclease D [Gammaproteobacteria bacterium]
MTSTGSPDVIDTHEPFTQLCDALRSAPVVAVDTEFMRVRTYAPVLCLIQIYDGHQAVCVDALKIENLGALIEVFGQHAQPTLLHSARQDLETFFLGCGALPTTLFDTQIAAALTGPDDQLSYAQLVEDIAGVTLAKSQTRTNWAKRPLTSHQLQYAADDVRYLPALHDHLRDKLIELDRLSWFEEDCARLLSPKLYEPDLANAWRRCKSRRPFSDDQRGAFRALCALRERVAVVEDKPRKWIIEDAGIEQLAALDTPDGSAIRGVLHDVRAHRSLKIDDILTCIEEAPPATDKRPDRMAPEQMRLVTKAMDLLRKRAGELDIAPSILAPRRDIERFVRGERDGTIMNGWRRDVIGLPLSAAFD